MIRICVRCDRVITGESKTIPVDSTSGARPDRFAHLPADPDCPPIEGAGREPGYWISDASW